MSYCRFGPGSDVYMYDSGSAIECVMCNFAPLTFAPMGDALPPCPQCRGAGCEECMIHGDFIMHTRIEAVNHLRKHQAFGDLVSPYAEKSLLDELAEKGDAVKEERLVRQEA